MTISGPINEMPQKLSSVRQSELLMQYAETRGRAREQETNAQMTRANAMTSAVETSIKGAIVNKNSI